MKPAVPKITHFKSAVQKVIEEKAQNPVPDSECETLNLESPYLKPNTFGKSIVLALSRQKTTKKSNSSSPSKLKQFFSNFIATKDSPAEPSPPRRANRFHTLINTLLKTNKKVTPVQELGPEVIKHKFHRAFQIIRVMSRLYRISEDIQLYGTSSNLYDLTTRDRTRVRKILYPSVLDEAGKIISEEKDLKWFIVHPKSQWRQFWSVVVIFLLTYTAVITPYRLTFGEAYTDNWKIVDYFIDALFFIDIIMNFVSAYYDEEGRLVKDLSTLAKKYLKSWFLLDLLAVLPFDVIQDWFTEVDIISPTQANLNRVIRLFRLPRLYRLVQLVKMNHFFKFIKGSRFVEWIELNSILLKLLGFFVTVVSLMHIMACLWFFIAKMAGNNADTWIVRNDLVGSSNPTIYIASLYYIFVTLATVGYGDICAVTIPERLFSIVLMILGVGFYSFTIALISLVLSSRENRESSLKRKISIASEFADEIKAPRSLKLKIGQILEYNSFRNCFSWAGKRELFSEIPITLRYEIVMSMHNGILNSIPFFREHSDKYFVVTIAELLKPLQINARDFLWKEGDSAESMYFLIAGKVHLLSLEFLTPEDRIKNVKGSIIFKRYMAGSYFGEIEIIHKCKRSYALQASTQAELFYLTKHDYYNVIIPEFPHIHEELKEIAQERYNRNIESLVEIRNFLQAHIPEEKKGSRILSSRSNSGAKEGAKEGSNYLQPVPHVPSIELPRTPQSQSKSMSPERKTSFPNEINLLNQSKNSVMKETRKRLSIESRSPRLNTISFISVENLPPRVRKVSGESIESLMSSLTDSDSQSSIFTETSSEKSSVKEEEPSLENDISNSRNSRRSKEVKPKTMTSVADSQIQGQNLLRVSRSKSFFTNPIISDDMRRRRSIGSIFAIKNAVIVSSEERLGKKKRRRSKDKGLLRLAAGVDIEEPSSLDAKIGHSSKDIAKTQSIIKSTRRISFADEKKPDKIIELLKKSEKNKTQQQQKAGVLKKEIAYNDTRLKNLESKLQDIIKNVQSLME